MFLWKMQIVVTKITWIRPKSFFQPSRNHLLLVWKQWLCYNYPLSCASATLMIHVSYLHNKEEFSNSKPALELSAECSDVFGAWLWTFSSHTWRVRFYRASLRKLRLALATFLNWADMWTVFPTKDAPKMVYVGHIDVQIFKTHPER